jgi:hypothetical protein
VEVEQSEVSETELGATALDSAAPAKRTRVRSLLKPVGKAASTARSR